jgi:hypothetical protein
MDSWLQYTNWNEVLSQSKHNLIKTFRFTREPDRDEPELERVLRAWNHFGHISRHRPQGRIKVADVAEKRSSQPETVRVAAECQEFGAIQRGVGGFHILHDAPERWGDGTGKWQTGRRQALLSVRAYGKGD